MVLGAIPNGADTMVLLFRSFLNQPYRLPIRLSGRRGDPERAQKLSLKKARKLC